ncbi:hypothetical protein C8R44DRAFT_726118 [Mycena epipterygia]|nr:hypothetical protein C8R44DRAFT_726118 [Mycena epipterygia]
MYLTFKLLQVLLLTAAPLFATPIVPPPGEAVAVSSAASSVPIHVDLRSPLAAEDAPSIKAHLGQCIPLTSAQFVTFEPVGKAGYKVLLDYFTSVGARFVGDGVTDPHTGESTLSACFGTGSTPVPVKSLGPPKCYTTEKLSKGKIIGAAAQVTLAFKVRDQHDHFDDHDHFEATESSESSDSITLNAPEGSECQLQVSSFSSVACPYFTTPRFNVTTCTTTVISDVPITAVGSVWFSKKMYEGQSNEWRTKYSWRGWMNSLELKRLRLMDPVNPSSMRLEGTMSTRSVSNYYGICTRL